MAGDEQIAGQEGNGRKKVASLFNIAHHTMHFAKLDVVDYNLNTKFSLKSEVKGLPNAFSSMFPYVGSNEKRSTEVSGIRFFVSTPIRMLEILLS